MSHCEALGKSAALAKPARNHVYLALLVERTPNLFLFVSIPPEKRFTRLAGDHIEIVAERFVAANSANLGKRGDRIEV